MVIAVLADSSRPSAVRQMAAFSLGLLGTRQSIAPLISATRDADPAVAALACDALGRFAGDAAVGPLTIALAARDPIVRRRAAIGMGEAGLPATTPALSNAARSNASHALSATFNRESDPEVRWRLAWAIARGYYGTSASVMRRMLGDREELVRRFGVYGIGKLKDRANVTAVRLLVRDPSWRVRVEVRNALKALKDPTQVDVAPPAVPAFDKIEPAALPKGAPLGAHPQIEGWEHPSSLRQIAW